jgi:hypothetical protein
VSKASDATRKSLAKIQAMKEAITDIGKPANMRKYGEQLAGMIRLRTRLGSGVSSPGADKEPLKPLAESTIQARKGKIAFYEAPNGKRIPYPRSKSHDPVKLSEFTTPSKSNLTRTGQLLDSHGVKSVSQGSVTIGPTGTRKPEGKIVLTNQQVSKFVTEGGRPYASPSRIEVKRINDQMKRDLRNFIKQRLTKNK